MSIKHSNCGFTIVELVVVIVVIAILATLTAFGFSKLKDQGLDSEYESKVSTIMSALEKYYDKNGEYPSNNDLNPNKQVPMTNFNDVIALLQGTKESDFKASDGHSFISYCTSTSTPGCPVYSSTLWNETFSKSFIYISRLGTSTTGQEYYVQISQSSSFPLGWGCKITTYYDTPGFIIAWRSNDDGIWHFYRSKHGKIDIENHSGGPTQPGQTCTFSYP